MHKARLGDERLHRIDDVQVHVVKLFLGLLDGNVIAMTILVLQVVW